MILIFGDPGHGKTHLADHLHDTYGYYLVSLDELYVEFIQNRYPRFFLDVLPDVIAQHYLYMFAQDPSRVAAWCEHVVLTTKDASTQNQLVAVEGYLLLPALSAVEQRLADLAAVTTVEVRNHQYFVASNVEQIAPSERAH